ncbi:MAG: apolipoprotein N-acyltransferase [Verrucomicrobiota bacterium]
MNRWPSFWPYFAALGSGLLLSLCYPNFNISWLAWIWMIPLLFSLWFGRPDRWANQPWKRARYGFTLGYLAGLAFFQVNLSWLHTVSSGGAILLPFYLALYFALWGAFAATAGRPRDDELAPGLPQDKPSPRHAAPSLFTNIFANSLQAIKYATLNAAAWTGLEWLRGVAFTGFGWNGLGVALHNNLFLIQITDIIGVTGLAFLLMFCGCIATTTIRRLFLEVGHQRSRPHLDFIAAIALVLLVFAYGLKRAWRADYGDTIDLRVVLIQPNININDKWDASKTQEFYRLFDDLTSIYAETGDYDLIVWPETALQAEFLHPSSQGYLNFILSKGDFHLILGVEEGNLHDGTFYNSMALIRNNTRNYQTYKKIHLVPFGEYIPLRKSFPPFEWVAGREVPADFNAGDTIEPLTLTHPPVQIIPAICFEDTIGSLMRQFIRDEPQLIVNVTNDGWFLETQASEQHLANAKFRSAELKRPMARSANTGVSCFINHLGEIPIEGDFEARIQDIETGSTFVTGTLPYDISILKNPPITTYAQVGDLFSKACLALATIWILACFLAKSIPSSRRKDRAA